MPASGDLAKEVAAYHVVAAELALKLNKLSEAAAEFERASRLEPTKELQVALCQASRRSHHHPEELQSLFKAGRSLPIRFSAWDSMRRSAATRQPRSGT